MIMVHILTRTGVEEIILIMRKVLMISMKVSELKVCFDLKFMKNNSLFVDEI